MDLPAGGAFPGLPGASLVRVASVGRGCEALGAAVATQLGCADPATAPDCLRGKTPQDLFPFAQPFQPYGFGGRVLPEVPAQALRDGRFQRVPVISGGTRDEQRLFVGLFRVLAGQPVTAEQYPTLLAEAFGEQRRQGPRHSIRYRATRRRTWRGRRCSPTACGHARPTSSTSCFAEHVPTYAYEFADRQAPMYLPFPDDFPPGAFHAAEVPDLFPDQKFQAGSTPDQRRLSEQMMRYWANFARSGDPTATVCRRGRHSLAPSLGRSCCPWRRDRAASTASTTPRSIGSTSGLACPAGPPNCSFRPGSRSTRPWQRVALVSLDRLGALDRLGGVVRVDRILRLGVLCVLRPIVRVDRVASRQPLLASAQALA